MLNAGIDYHKRYSQVDVLDEKGERRAAIRLPNDRAQVEEFFRSLGEPCRAVLEAGWNWGVMYDWLEGIDNVTEVQLAHPTRTRAIAAAQVKTDAIDAHTLAQLLRADLIPKAHIPGRQTREFREIVRQRLFLVRVRTKLKNRIHALLGRQHVEMPGATDLFGARGRKYLSQVELEGSNQDLLAQDLRLLMVLNAEIKSSEELLGKALEGDRRMELLLTAPGLGPILSAVVALEIDEIKRFPTPAKLASYAGLVPTTHSSGGHSFHGRLIRSHNRWLRWALVEAAWVAVRLDPYFRSYYHQRAKTKRAQTAVIAAARRLLEVIWHMLMEQRPYRPGGATRSIRCKSPAALATV